MTSLAGRSVLIGGSAQFGRELAAELTGRGAVAELAPFIRTVPAPAGPLRAALARLDGGGFDWIVVTSQATIRVLESWDVHVPASTRVAAVGPATARALESRGFDVALVPAEHSARGLLADPAFAGLTGARVLLPQSELAAPTLADGLRELGHEVSAIVAYRIEAVPAPVPLTARIRAGEFDAIVVSSGSVGSEVVRQCAPLPDTTRVVAIGPATADAARDAGLRVDAWGAERSPVALADALERALAGSWRAPADAVGHDREESP